jgi:hypothetical protein
MSDDEIITSLTNGGPGYFEMDEAFCARMRAAIAAGLESADWYHHHARDQKFQILPDARAGCSACRAVTQSH